MTNDSRILYIGVTSDLSLLGYKHKNKLAVGVTNDVQGAIVRKEQ